jgi:purine-cytosine permease-like protein
LHSPSSQTTCSSFLTLIAWFRLTGINSPNTYSAALSIQALHSSFARVPRAVWTFVVFVIYVVAGVAGREHFSEILSNFLSILGYWIAFFVAILLEEHYIFRRPGGTLGGYDFTAYDDARRLPVGIAGILAICFGIAGAVVGMAEVWYIGPIAKHIGPSGGDLVRLSTYASTRGLT